MAKDGDYHFGPGMTDSKDGMRTRSERLVLAAINRLGSAPGSELARHTGLSAQSVSVVLRTLEADGLVQRGTPQKGRVGKPSVPMGLAADGAFSVGLKIGRRSADLALMDFHGQVRGQVHTQYRYPMPDAVFAFLEAGLETLFADLTSDARSRVCGAGIAVPYQIWEWPEALSAPSADLDAWRQVDFANDVGARTGLDVTVLNDATAACMAENALGQGPGVRDYAYLFVGSFIGGGIVLGGAVFDGPHGNAGGFGPVASLTPEGRPTTLLDSASLYLLEEAIARAGGTPADLWSGPRDWQVFAEHLDPWIDNTGAAIAQALISICSVIDFSAVVIDGAFPPLVRSRLVARVRDVLETLDIRGLVLPDILPGRVGENARALGAAYAPISIRYLSEA